MSCLCGDLGCPSCGSAQGSDPTSEAAFDYVYARLTEWLDTTTVIVFQGDEYDATLLYAARFSDEFNVKFSDGDKEGLVRLTAFVLDLMKEAVDAARQADEAARAEVEAAAASQIAFEVERAEDEARLISDYVALHQERLERLGPVICPSRSPDQDESYFDWNDFYRHHIDEE